MPAQTRQQISDKQHHREDDWDYRVQFAARENATRRLLPTLLSQAVSAYGVCGERPAKSPAS